MSSDGNIATTLELPRAAGRVLSSVEYSNTSEKLKWRSVKNIKLER